MKVVNLTIARSVPQAAIAERGADYKDPKAGYAGNQRCTYWNAAQDGPGCLVATGLFVMGLVDKETLIRWDTESEDGTPESIDVVTNPPDVTLTEDARSYLAELQASQDRGESWGEAKRIADMDCWPESYFD